jgi:hypothetical protein
VRDEVWFVIGAALALTVLGVHADDPLSMMSGPLAICWVAYAL